MRWRWLGRLLAWFVVVDALITAFGATTAPLLLLLAADAAVVWFVIRSCRTRRRYGGAGA